MEYTISIDQDHSLRWGLTLSEAHVFGFCTKLNVWAIPILIEGEVWYFASRKKIVKELPIVTEKPDTIYRILKSLDAKGVIRWQKYDGKDCIQVTNKGKKWNSEKNPSNARELGKKSELARKKIRVGSEKNPTYHNTIDHNTIDQREEPTLSPSPEQKTETPTSQPHPPSPETFFAPDKHERAADEVIRYLEENRRYLNGMEAGDWHRAVRGHCLKLQSSGKWADLTIPGQDGLYFSWIGRRIAGAKSWFSAAAEIDKNGKNNRSNVPNTPPQTWNPETARNVFLRLCAEDGLIPGEEPGL